MKRYPVVFRTKRTAVVSQYHHGQGVYSTVTVMVSFLVKEVPDDDGLWHYQVYRLKEGDRDYVDPRGRAWPYVMEARQYASKLLSRLKTQKLVQK